MWDTGLEQFTIRKTEAAINIQSHVNARWSWSSGLRASNRTSDKNGDRNGYLLTYQAGLHRRLLSLPERRLTVGTSAHFEFGKQFERMMISANLHWLPRAIGDDYESTISVRAGRSGGVVPFDEYFALGVDRDQEYFMRGHQGIRGGRKGAGPIGQEFMLANFDLQKNLFNAGFVKASAGPFIDLARLTRTEPTMVDAGISLRFSLVSGLTLDFSYGLDLRTRHGAFLYRSH
jgi:hypothetical protein